MRIAPVFLLLGVYMAAPLPRGAATTTAAGADSTVAAKAAVDSATAASSARIDSAADTSVAQVPQRDAFDVLNEYVLHRRVEPEASGTLKTGLSWTILPSLNYNPVYGWAIGASLSGAGRRGAESFRFSQLSISGNVSTTGQIQAQIRGDLFDHSGNYLLKADIRYLDTTRSTWGLGPYNPNQEEYPMDYKLVRTYATWFRRASGPVFVGLGFHYDEFDDIVDSRAEQGEATPYTTYSGGPLSHSQIAGFSLNVLGDTRDNLVNPSSGYYLGASFRAYYPEVGSDATWQEIWVEMRLYPHLPSRGRGVLAFWLYGWTTYGRPPYLNFPSNGWDTYGRGARGYLQGRIRGASQFYLETEYRWPITSDGLWGAVAFVNATTTETDNGILGPPDGAVGVGLRIKFNKHSNTNLAIDQGWGKNGSKVLFFGMSETF
jgi:hypothetical protein